MLWLALYVIVVLAPLALVAVAVKPGAQGVAVVVAAALGFGALTLLVLQPLVSGRWGSITSAFGLRSVLALHRQAGTAALVLVIAHVVALIVDDPARLALLDPRDAPVRARAGMFALLAMIALAATSVWRGQLRMSYERWRAVHVVCAAVVIAGSFVHVVGVSAYASLPALRWAVLALAVTGVAAIFSVRVARPYAMTLRRFRVRDVRRERGRAVSVELEAAGHDGVRFLPGQFAWVKPAGSPYGMGDHPFSLSSSAERPQLLTFTVKAVGDFTHDVARLEPGAELLVDGPHGAGVPDERCVRGRLLLAAGVGITPIMSVLRTAAERGDRRPMVLVYGNRHWENVAFREELVELERLLPGLRVVHVLSRPHPGWDGERGRIDEDVVRRHAPADHDGWSALVCGPPGMVAAASAALRRLGLPQSAIQAEGFG